MLRRLWQRLRLRREIRRDARAIEKHLRSLERQVENSLDILTGVESQIEQLRTDAKALEDIQLRTSQENDRLRAELEIANNITIPGLTASHVLLMQRTEADTAIQVKRQAVAGA